MATKKAGSTAKKTTKKSAVSKPSTTTTKVTTVKAVEAETPDRTTTARPRLGGSKVFVASALIGEFIGTFLLTVIFMGTKGDPLYVGFGLAAIVLIVGALSGAHVNPAVTVGAWVTRKITSLRALGYIVAQVLGATLAFTTLNLFISAVPQADPQAAAMMGQSAPQLFQAADLTDKNHWYIFFIELIAATIFTFAVASARRELTDRTAKALTIGLGLMVAGVFATITANFVQATAAFNPAVALAIQAVDWTKIDWMTIAAYLVAPLLGGVLGFGLREVLSAGESKKA